MFLYDPQKAAADRAARTRIILIGCGKTKQETGGVHVPAQDLYTGNLFLARRRYAEKSNLQWWIFSAKHGLLDRQSRVLTYDQTFSRMPIGERARVGMETLQLLGRICGSMKATEYVIELHAGRVYAEALKANFRPGDMDIETPLEGLGIGQQLAWYAAR